MDYLERGPQQRGNSSILPGVRRPVRHSGSEVTPESLLFPLEIQGEG